ncbi:hypothetical protein P692DRAFT_20882627 [Suillus brevipes Sb2]|nr:hypothetical protein P692DRAFT_20882627 [Suillus brevipes Sb2]
MKPLPQSVQDFFDMSSEPDLEGYDADTSLCVSDGRSDTPHMTTSDDLLLNPVFWNLAQPLVSVETVSTTTILDPESVTEPESEPEATPNNITSPPVISADPESVTEPESEPEATPNNIQLTSLPAIPDPESVTEPESETDTAPPPVSTTPKPKKTDWTDFFATPSPPSPTSNYWKYVTPEEDALWYDRARTDSGFRVVRQMKQELREIK